MNLKRSFCDEFSGGCEENESAGHQHHRPRFPPRPLPLTWREFLISGPVLQRIHTSQRKRAGLQVSHAHARHSYTHIRLVRVVRDCYGRY